MLAAENFVVISRGAKDGLDVGNRTFVVRRGDGYRPIMEGWQKPDPSFPKEVVAELWVMDVREDARSPGWPGPPRSCASARWPSCVRGTD